MMITDYASQEAVMPALNKGASVYIIRPFDMQEVLTIIRETFKKYDGIASYLTRRSKAPLKTHYN